MADCHYSHTLLRIVSTRKHSSYSSRLHFTLTIQAIASRLRPLRRTPQLPIRTRILARIVARRAPTRKRRLSINHRTKKIPAPAGISTGAIRRGPAVLHCAVRSDELQLRVAVAVVSPGVVARRAARYCGLAGAGFWTELVAEASVFGGVVAGAAA